MKRIVQSRLVFYGKPFHHLFIGITMIFVEILWSSGHVEAFYASIIRMKISERISFSTFCFTFTLDWNVEYQ